jgi:ketosteroid isomerase-like protein
MSTPAETGLQRWHDVIESGDVTRLPGIIAEDAVFRSPAIHTPQEGRDLVAAYLGGAMKVLGEQFRYDDQWVREGDAVLLFSSVVDGLQVQGVDLIVWDEDGQIVSFTVMIRPVKALQAVMTRMLEQLT